MSPLTKPPTWPSVAFPTLLAALLLLSSYPSAYGGSIPEVGAPTCVKWCGNETKSSGSTPSRKTSKHTPVPTIDVGAMMDAAQARKNKAKQTDRELAKTADAVRQQQEAKNRADAAAARAAFSNNDLLLKDVTIDAPNNITLKPIPPAARSARSQLDCVANIKANLKDLDSGAGNWESASGGCAPITPAVPEPPPPTRVENQADQLAKMLDELMKQITNKREELTQLDQEIVSREQEIAQESLKIVSPDKPESDALRRAREALEKARADRARTADELAKLEQQEQSARKPAAQ